MKKELFVLVFGLWCQLILAEGEFRDSVQVEEVVVTGVNLTHFQAGAKVQKIPEEQFKAFQDGGLEQLLQRYTPIAVKGMAGSLATIRLRGTSPNHTGIMFGGLNINSLTLGHSNVSNVPMYLFDEVAIQYGSASVVNGSGSIGGAVHLGMNNYWVNGFKGEARLAQGSFGEQLYGTKLFYGNGKIEGVTRIYYYAKTNNFPFYNTTYDFSKNGPFGDDTQHNAGIDNKGLIQELNYRFSRQEQLTVKAWLEHDWHEIQQNMQTNAFQPKQRETLYDDHVRIWSEYKNEKKAVGFSVGAGYVYDNSVHNGSENSIATNRFVSALKTQYELAENTQLKFGADWQAIHPDVYAYSSDLKREDWVDFHMSVNQNLFKRLKLTLNMRQGFVTNFSVPFTPAIGFTYNALVRETSLLSVLGNVAKSYRVPTFNDRYWVPGGNPDLVPEEGMNYEIGFKYGVYSEGVKSNIKVNLFYLDVNNWLMWVNGGNGWEARNVDHVVSRGVELQADAERSLGEFILSHGLVYTYNPVVRKAVDDGESVIKSAVGRQLEYVPLHRGMAFITCKYSGYSLGADLNYTHDQFTSQAEGTLPGYTLMNIQVQKSLTINTANSLRMSLLLNNLFNTDYQLSAGYPMPGFNYRISITYNFK